METTAASSPSRSAPDKDQIVGRFLALATVLTGLVFFHQFGNETKGYIATQSTLVWWLRQWFMPGGDLDHAPLVLILAVGFFVWNAKRMTQLPDRPNAVVASVLLAAGLLLALVGSFIQQTRFSIVGFFLVLWAASWIGGGQRWGRGAVFPLILLAFTMPLGFLLDEVGFMMRLGVISVSRTMAEAIGFEVIQNGTILRSGDGSYQYDVAPACSGTRSLIALMALCLVVGYIQFRQTWRRALIFLLALPFAFVGNVCRIFTIIVVAELIGEEAGTVVHDWFGFIIFAVVLGLALLTASFLERLLPEPRKAQEDGPFSCPEPLWRPRGSLWSLGFLAVGTLATFATGSAIHAVREAGQDLQCGLILNEEESAPASLPRLLGYVWLGQDVAVSKVERQILPEDTGFARKLYTSLEGHYVYLSIVLSGGDRSSIHRPELCIVGNGMTIRSRQRETLMVGEGREIEVTLLQARGRHLTTGEELDQTFAYWFVGGDRMVASNLQRTLEDWRARLGGRPHRWAYAYLQTPSAETPEDTIARLEEVAQLAAPYFLKPELFQNKD